MAVYSIDKKEVDRCIDDLLKKYPEGSRKQLTKADYGTSWTWRQSTDRYMDMVVCNADKWCGWDPEIIARVGFYVDQTHRGMRYYLTARWDDIGSKAVSRRENRLHDRMNEARRHFMNSGISEAIWRVKLGYSTEVHVISSSEKSAEMMGKTVAAGAGILSNDSKYWASKVGPADPQLLQKLRTDQVGRITKTIESNGEKIKEIRKQSAALVELCVALQDFNEHLESM